MSGESGAGELEEIQGDTGRYREMQSGESGAGEPEGDTGRYREI
jgi:hypothetical protein